MGRRAGGPGNVGNLGGGGAQVRLQGPMKGHTADTGPVSALIERFVPLGSTLAFLSSSRLQLLWVAQEAVVSSRIVVLSDMLCAPVVCSTPGQRLSISPGSIPVG